MKSILITNARIVNEEKIYESDLLIKNGRIEKIGGDLSGFTADLIIDAEGKYLLPGVIDDQVHFREPGLTHKGDIHSCSRAAVAGGITSFMEMPNTVPNAVTQQLLEDKYRLAAEKSLANFSFYMGATNDNIEELLKTDPERICGIKVFMGSSTGNMLVDNLNTLENIFSVIPLLIATHCEDEQTIQANMKAFRDQYGEDLPVKYHPLIRSAEACYLSSSLAVDLAKKFGTRLHLLHLSTAKEMSLLDNSVPAAKKHITAEVCVHHLWFNEEDYDRKGNFIKWNPAIKSKADQAGLWEALLDGRIDVIATDHAPHTLREKQNTYFKAPSGGPLVQHSLPAMLQFYHAGRISLEQIVRKMCHTPADIFHIRHRGYIREGYWADLTLVDPGSPWIVDKGNILYKCGWSPFEGEKFDSRITHTIVSGHLVYENGKWDESARGKRLTFSHG